LSTVSHSPAGGQLSIKSLLVRLTLGLHEQDVLDEERPYIQEWLDAKILVQEETLYRLPSKYRAGTIGTVQNNTAYLQVLGATVRDLFIDAEHLKDAKEGDLVIAQRLLGKRGAPSAKIVLIVGRAETYSVGYIALKEGSKSLLDIRTEYPVGVPLPPAELEACEEGDVFQINNQTAEVMGKLGNLRDPLVDEKIVLALYNKHDDFDEEVLKLAASFPKSVDASLYPKRKDLRHLPFCTIDPVTAKDFDDAVCYDAENSLLHVAIADVSAYVEPFGAIDAEAIYRGFSIYLPHRSIPMLPRQLSETLCSLQPHVDRLSYVFTLHLDPDTLEVTETELHEAIIHSKRRFTYEEVDALFLSYTPNEQSPSGYADAESASAAGSDADKPRKIEPADGEEKQIFDMLLKLRKVTDRLKQERMKTGYDFRSTDLEMRVDENQLLTATEYAEETPSHALIEDCMLLANKAAAAMFERGIFRIHEQPSPAKLQSLYQELAGIGIIVEPKASMRETITFIQEQAELRGIASEVDTLIIRAQMQARYAADNKGHFGLGFERYTHFTSPIRRYSDLIVHRLLKAIQAGDTEEGSYVLRNIDALAITISEKEREASDIEFRYMDRKFARWASERIGQSFKARIDGTDPVISAEIHDAVVGPKVTITSTQPLMLFDDVLIRIETVNLATAKITASVLEKLSTETDAL
jgi:ribonuclease R